MDDPFFVVHLDATKATIPYESVSDALIGYLAVHDTHTPAATLRPHTAPPGKDVVVAVQCGRQMFGFTHADVLVLAERFGLPQPVGKYGSTAPLVDLAILEFVWGTIVKTFKQQRGMYFVDTSAAKH
jgi:hypothetical protein